MAIGFQAMSGPWLSVLLTGALALRLVGIQHGLPEVYEHDEIHAVQAALRHGSGDWAPLNFLHGSLLEYILAIFFGLYYVLGRMYGHFHNAEDVLVAFIHDPTIFYLIGRVMIAVFGALIVWTTYVAARELYDRRVGLLGGLFVGVSVLHVNMSHLIKEDILATALLGCAFLCCAKAAAIASRGGSIPYPLFTGTGVFIGLATSAKYYTAPATVWLAILAWREWRRGSQSDGVRRVALCLGVGVAAIMFGFMIGQPYAVLRAKAFMQDILGQWTQYSTIPNPAGASSVTLYFGQYIPYSIGAGLSVLAALGCIAGLALRAERYRTILLYSFPALWLAVLLRSSAFPHFLTPIVPFLLIASAALLVRLADYITPKLSYSRWTLASAAVLLLVQPLAGSLRYDRYAMGQDTRQLSKHWMEAHVGGQERIAVEGAVFEYIVFGPPLEADQKTIEAELAEIKRRGGNGRLWQVKSTYAAAAPARRFSLCKTMELSMSELGRCRAQVAIVVTDAADRAWAAVPHERRQFLTEIEQRYTLIKQFEPTPGLKFFPTMWTLREEFPRLSLVPIFAMTSMLVAGPTIRIYRVKEEGSSAWAPTHPS